LYVSLPTDSSYSIAGETYMNNTAIRVQVNVGGTNITSPEKPYCVGHAFVGYWTLIVNMDKGNIASLTWDDDPGMSGTSCI